MSETTDALRPREVLDVSALPKSVLDHRSPIWWGNLMLLFIESTMFALLIASYFYIWPNFHVWPPVQGNLAIATYNPVPQLKVPAINLIVILFSLVPMIWADRAAIRRDAATTKIALVLAVVVGAVAILLRFREFQSLQFRWDDNAYASVVWTTVGMHLLHLLIGTAENLIMAAWVFVHGVDDKHARDIHVTGIYWYWVVGMWVLLFAIFYLGPRWM